MLALEMPPANNNAQNQCINTALTKLLGVKVPIVLAPMSTGAGGTLAGQIHKYGGYGFIPAGDDTCENLKKEVQRFKDVVKPSPAIQVPCGVGFLTWYLEAGHIDLLITALELKVQAVLFTHSEHIDRWISFVRGHDQVRNAFFFFGFERRFDVPVHAPEHAKVAADFGADVVVAQGIEAGGHGANYAPPILVQLTAVKNAIPAPEDGGPLICMTGGITTGAHIAGLLAAGAHGCMLGTRMLLAKDSYWSKSQRELFVATTANDATIRTLDFDVMVGSLGWPKGIDGRALKNLTTKEMAEDKPVYVVRAKYETAAREGDAERIATWAGLGVVLIDKPVETAKEIMDCLVDECIDSLKKRVVDIQAGTDGFLRWDPRSSFERSEAEQQDTRSLLAEKPVFAAHERKRREVDPSEKGNRPLLSTTTTDDDPFPPSDDPEPMLPMSGLAAVPRAILSATKANCVEVDAKLAALESLKPVSVPGTPIAPAMGGPSTVAESADIPRARSHSAVPEDYAGGVAQTERHVSRAAYNVSPLAFFGGCGRGFAWAVGGVLELGWKGLGWAMSAQATTPRHAGWPYEHCGRAGSWTSTRFTALPRPLFRAVEAIRVTVVAFCALGFGTAKSQWRLWRLWPSSSRRVRMLPDTHGVALEQACRAVDAKTPVAPIHPFPPTPPTLHLSSDHPHLVAVAVPCIPSAAAVASLSGKPRGRPFSQAHGLCGLKQHGEVLSTTRDPSTLLLVVSSFVLVFRRSNACMGMG
ncbi:2-nitropropane dioxygenase [Mycena chlorophos]|uniref:2-nitropropane dioxygenase n=1 Tax=Mycena chlorophos TaxID=658473 RepID=A0A8H6TMI0_MYCCL|nr:2-nitropropane dioxygenase [Mycena chlorophos]